MDTFEIVGSLVSINSDKLKGFESKTSEKAGTQRLADLMLSLAQT